MNWKQLLAHITGSVDQKLLLRNEYLATEDRILRTHSPTARTLGRSVTAMVISIVPGFSILS